MAPLKQTQPSAVNLAKGITTRSQVPLMKKELPKRKADESPLKRLTVKRFALNEVTNVTKSSKENAVQLVKAKITSTVALKKPVLTANEGQAFKPDKSKITVRIPRKKENGENQVPPNLPPAQKTAVKTLKEKPPVPAKPLAVKNDENGAVPKTQSTSRGQSIVPMPVKVVRKQQLAENHVPTVGVVTRRSLKKSLELEKTSESSSLYVSALEDLNLTDSKPSTDSCEKKKETVVESKLPPGVTDYDLEMAHDIFCVPIYAKDIFSYLKKRESDFVISDYLGRQKDLSPSMRAILVDWMVDIQESFELVHESLYLGVKLVDLFLSKHVINRDRLQLIGAVCLFVASKYDERIPPTLDDFISTCDGLYQATEFLMMEKKVLQAVDYSLGIPLSYRFLRRYARCAKYDLPTLTLARYILETNLMNYKTIKHSDSKMAAAAMFLALQMKNHQSWTQTLKYYSGYGTEDFKQIVFDLNDYLAAVPKGLKTIKGKYSHAMFYEVTKISHVPNDKLNFNID